MLGAFLFHSLAIKHMFNLQVPFTNLLLISNIISCCPYIYHSYQTSPSLLLIQIVLYILYLITVGACDKGVEGQKLRLGACIVKT